MAMAMKKIKRHHRTAMTKPRGWFYSYTHENPSLRNRLSHLLNNAK